MSTKAGEVQLSLVKFFGEVLHHILQLDMLRVLSPDGKFVAMEPNRLDFLDFLELLEWGVADLHGKLTPNKYPIDPLVMRCNLLANEFSNPCFWTIRHDIPVLAQIPILSRFFSRQKEFALKRLVLKLIDAFRAPKYRGTFFNMVAEKK